MNELRNLARFILSFCLENAPEAVVNAAHYCVLDSMGAALGAVHYGEIPGECERFKKWFGTSAPVTASVWGRGEKMTPTAALLLNGIMAHALELDDVHTGSKSHVGAVIVTTAWTLADALGIGGKEFLEAVIVGYETMARIGLGMDVVSNRKRGWHTTGLIGTFGAAAAAARLLKLSEDQTVSALGMAGSQSAGLWAFLTEGATCKKLSPARAAVNGLTSALLAQGGMTGPEHILDAEDGGFYAAVTDRFDMLKVDAELGMHYEILNIDKKPYPCCRSTHHSIDAALILREKYHIDPEQIASVLVETYDVGVLQCGFAHYPSSYVEAKFSIAYTCATAFVRGKVTQAEFRGGLLEDPQIKRIAENMKVIPDKLFTKRYPKRWGSRMTVTLKNDRVLTQQIDDMSGSKAAPMSPEQEQGKFIGLAVESFSLGKAQKLMAEILKIETLEKLPDLS
ncbi:MmgE/PrpD family protein [Pyramidobacter piscolens]|uniref:MmgE/PrpD family protein n=1 Tax=Pyramidobacter piscolens TaxID=638849 RepID=UPI001FCAB5B5|nr:MmgE/PrpD family protein [Pyramidobacter piscolens]BDF79529.1 hypothetical protein CE91St28_23230 [Pyramidobacter piscolens]